LPSGGQVEQENQYVAFVAHGRGTDESVAARGEDWLAERVVALVRQTIDGFAGEGIEDHTSAFHAGGSKLLVGAESVAVDGISKLGAPVDDVRELH
jgi:hypothetical protein